MALTYNQLKEVYKVKRKNLSLFNYLLANTPFNRSLLFHSLNKREIIAEYKKITEEHLKILEDL